MCLDPGQRKGHKITRGRESPRSSRALSNSAAEPSAGCCCRGPNLFARDRPSARIDTADRSTARPNRRKDECPDECPPTGDTRAKTRYQTDPGVVPRARLGQRRNGLNENSIGEDKCPDECPPTGGTRAKTRYQTNPGFVPRIRLGQRRNGLNENWIPILEASREGRRRR